ncbi:MAG: LuxR family transcriptional regulator [Rhodospirillaceae bacterium]|nr:LuxR family transcriptional regulator [Rhodospirillaceae bacterium]
MKASLEAILSDLDSLKSEALIRSKLAATFDAYGYNYFTYAGLDADEIRDATPGQPLLSDLIYLTNLKAEWVAHYLESDYAHVDPVVRECTEQRLPIRWDEKFKANTRNTFEAQMMDDAWENGLKRGLTIPVHGPRGELGIFSLNSDLSDKEFHKITSAKKYELQVIAYHFHDSIQRNLRAEKTTALPVPLTDREVEILKWTVEGKTAWEVGTILKISERTVNFHLQNVMEKFGVHNKTHAAAKAMHMGLLSA